MTLFRKGVAGSNPDGNDYLTQLAKHEVDKTGFYPLLQIYVLATASLASSLHIIRAFKAP